MSETKQNIKTAPLSTDDLIHLFENPGEVITLDYTNSQVKDDLFLTYVGNLKLECHLVGHEQLSFEEREKLLNMFIESKYTLEIITLKDAFASVFLGPEFSNYFTEEELVQYIERNKKDLEELKKFYYSMLIMIPSISNDFKELFLEPEIEKGVIAENDEVDLIGPNAYNMTFYPNFIDLFIGSCDQEYPLTYYKHVIETYQYKNKSFFTLLTEETAPSLMGVFNFFFNEEKSLEELVEETEKTEEEK